MNVLALNCGSSSVKFRLLAVDPGADVTQARALAGGIVDRLGPAADVRFEADGRSEHAEEAGDARDLLAREADDPRARLALDVFCHRARKYLGAYLAALEGADAVVFTGAMGARSPDVRARILRGFEWCGLALDDARNRAARGSEATISPPASAIRVLAIPADEERVIARETAACLAAPSR
jgi:acetate kinase